MRRGRVADPVASIAGFSVSKSGGLAYRVGTAIGGRQLIWVDRNGKPAETVGAPALYENPRLSPDGKRLAVFKPENGGDIWRLLVAMTLHKLRDQVDRQTAAKRSVDAEIHFGSEDSLFGIRADAFSRNPSPVMAAVLADELTGIMQGLEPVQRRMLEMRLQGHNLYEIAEATQFTQRTVRRVLERVKEQLRERYAAGSPTVSGVFRSCSSSIPCLVG